MLRGVHAWVSSWFVAVGDARRAGRPVVQGGPARASGAGGSAQKTATGFAGEPDAFVTFSGGAERKNS
ncbi:hypothetical protein GCM10012276_12530 [Nocardioides deserti]|nr:hypothetical protein GCM10012276_12530 [Nocardioides deserti]